VIDQKKRTTLKTITAAAAVAATPAAVAAGMSAISTASADAPLKIVVEGDGSVLVTNASTNATSLRHVSPGRVTAKELSYDLNELIVDGPLKLEAGATRRFKLKPVSSDSVEATVPGAAISPFMAEVTTSYDSVVGSSTTTTKRMMLV